MLISLVSAARIQLQFSRYTQGGGGTINLFSLPFDVNIETVPAEF
jgi:hypothetical protein